MPEPSFNYGGSFLLSAVHAIQQQDNAAGGPRDELRQYLKAGAEATTDIIGWWGVSLKFHAHPTHLIPWQINTRYPTLRKIARDYLAIQGSATPSERAFSSGGITGCARRNRLQPAVFEALQVLKSAYRNGHISATTEAAYHTEAFIRSLDSTDSDST
jgi:hypothetical protein